METVFLLQKLTWDYEDEEEDRGHAPNADILVNDKLSKTLQKLDSSVIGRSPVTAERQTGNSIMNETSVLSLLAQDELLYC